MNALENFQILQDIPNFLIVDKHIVTGGQPDCEQLEKLSAAGIDIVVNMAMPDSHNAIAEEGAIISAQGINYIHIPTSWKKPTLHDFLFFYQILCYANEQQQTVFVHCVRNMRVAVFIYLYSVLFAQHDADSARKKMESIWIPEDVWLEFIQEVLAYHQSPEHYPPISETSFPQERSAG